MKIKQIEYSQAFIKQIQAYQGYLNRQLGMSAAIKMLETFIDNFEKRILSYPHSAPPCEETSAVGMTNYRDYIDSGLCLRVIYRVDKADNTIYALLFLHTRQSIRQALIDYCLHW